MARVRFSVHVAARVGVRARSKVVGAVFSEAGPFSAGGPEPFGSNAKFCNWHPAPVIPVSTYCADLNLM